MQTTVEITFAFEAADAASLPFLQPVEHRDIVAMRSRLAEAILDTTDAPIEWGSTPPFAGADDPAYVDELTRRVVGTLDPDVMHDLRTLVNSLPRPEEDGARSGCGYSVLNDSGTMCVPCLPSPCHTIGGVLVTHCPGSRPFVFLWAPVIDGSHCAFRVHIQYWLRLTGFNR
jgi:hypothetical protein